MALIFHLKCTLKCLLKFVSILTSLKFCHLVMGWPITRRQILDSSKLKEFAEDNFKFDKYGRKLSKRVENTVGKGEIVYYEQFLFFPTVFSKGVIVREWVKTYPSRYWHSHVLVCILVVMPKMILTLGCFRMKSCSFEFYYLLRITSK